MKQKIFLLSAIIIIIITYSCKDNGTQPPVINYKHPRDMTWTADTLQTPEGAIQLLPQNLLVFSPTDAWLICWSDVLNGLVWSYNGEQWAESNSIEELGGFRVSDIAGKTSRDLWTAGYSGENVFMAHYNGTRWERYYPNIKGDILDMSIDASGNIWACGRNGLVMKYENNTWLADTINVGYQQTHPEAEFLLRSIISYNNQVHILGGLYHSELQLYINYHFKGYMNNWEMLDSMIIDSPSSIIKWGDLGLYETTNNFYSYGSLGIWEYQNSNWKKIYDFNGEIYEMYGQSNKYLIAVSAYRTVLFYNGNTWERIDELLNVDDPHFSFRNVWTNGYEIIIAGDGNIDGVQKTLVWHGK